MANFTLESIWRMMVEDLNEEFIRVDNLQTVDNKLFVKSCFSDKTRRYFKGDRLFATYDRRIDKINKSIVARAVGADVYLESIDACFLRSPKNVESIFREWFPRFLFSTDTILFLMLLQASDVLCCFHGPEIIDIVFAA